MAVYEKLMSIQQELKAPKGQYNAFGKYSYRSCEDIVEAVKPLAGKVKAVLTITDRVELVGERYYIIATATLMDAETGERLDDRHERGVRCSNMDCEDTKAYDEIMGKRGLGGDHPREALVLASKVAYAPGTVAELCWSDDPDYVTGYVGSRKFGYGRITVMKDMGDPVGGRVFFVKHGTDVKKYDDYMQNQTVLVRLPHED